LKLEFAEQLSNLAFNFNLRRYSEENLKLAMEEKRLGMELEAAREVEPMLEAGAYTRYHFRST